MEFYSTNNVDNRVGFSTAVRQGLAYDRGLFMPEEFPVLDQAFLDTLKERSLPEIAFKILQPFVGEDISAGRLQEICNDAFNFELPIVEIEPDLYSLELYHGPTLAFKDFGARFMARVLGELNSEGDSQNTILVATSGDTGSAVASGFYKIPNTQVVILYPAGKVSTLQEKQMTIEPRTPSPPPPPPRKKQSIRSDKSNECIKTHHFINK